MNLRSPDPRDPGKIHFRETARNLGFGMLPGPVLTARRLTGTDIRLYGLIVWHADHKGHAWPGQTMLSKEAHCSVDTTQRCLKTLKECGLLSITRAEPGTGNDYWVEPITDEVLRKLRLPARPAAPTQGGSRTGAATPSRTGAAS